MGEVISAGQNIILHLGAFFPEQSKIRFGAALCRQSRHPGLQTDTYIQQISGEGHLIGIKGKAKGIFDFSRVTGNIGALTPADYQNIPGNQKLDSLPNGAAPDIQLLCQLKFVGQLILCGELPIDN